MKTLVIIDFQKDFADPLGSLYVKGAEEAEGNIIDYMYNHKDEISEVVFTVDWHSINHCSFKRNGGIWPDHCIQYTEGAGISGILIQKCTEYGFDIKIFTKGTVDNIEEYGAFEYVSPWKHKGDGATYFAINNIGTNSFNYINNRDIVVCGIAGDYCVKSSIENLMKCREQLNIEVLMNGIASIDDGSTINEFVKENHLTKI